MAFDSNDPLIMGPEPSPPPPVELHDSSSHLAASNCYEGCGAEGPIRSIFLAEFHHLEGPRIRCQAPANGMDLLPKEVFDAVSVYIIPKQALAEEKITLNVLGYKISGVPIMLRHKKYKRNEFIFNLCFVCYPWSRTVQYEPAIKKLYEYLVNLELECEFVSREENTPDLQRMMENIYSDLNNDSRCRVSAVGGSDTQQLQLKITHYAPDPPVVHDYDVPILLIDWTKYLTKSWDLTTQALLQYMNGFNHVAKIAAMADVETHLVKSDVANLVYHGVAKILPIFLYSDNYAVTPKLRRLREDKEFQEQCLNIVSIDPRPFRKPKFRDVYNFVCGFSYGTTVKDLCLRQIPEQHGFCPRKLVQFLVLNNVLRKIHKYPIYLPDHESNDFYSNYAKSEQEQQVQTNLYKWFNGQRHFDEICAKTGIAPEDLEAKIESDPDVQTLRK